MRKLIPATIIAAACVLATPAQAHCPNACSTGTWRYFKAADLGVPATGTVTDAHIRTAVANSLTYNRSIEALIPSATMSQSRTSSTSGYAITLADFGWRFTPARVVWLPYRYWHQGQADRGSFAGGYYNWRVRIMSHSSTAH